MNIRRSFHSVVASDLRRYIALKQVLGRSFDTSCRIFLQLDRFLRELGKATDLTLETFQKWHQTLESLSPNTRLLRMRAVRHFCLYRRGPSQIVLYLMPRSSQKLALCCGRTSSRMATWQSYFPL